MDNENWLEFKNIIKMDDENIEKFKKLYGEGSRIPLQSDSEIPIYEVHLSFSQIIPEPSRDNADNNWVDNTKQELQILRKMNVSNENPAPDSMIGYAIKKWRMDNWGTLSDVLYDVFEEPFIITLESVLKGERHFYTFSRPPIKVYEKMAADGLVFETKWWSDAYDEWAIGKGQVLDGQFQYHIGPMTGSEKMSLKLMAQEFLNPKKNSDDRPTIVAKNREHLDQLIQCVQDYLKDELYTKGLLRDIYEVSGTTIWLGNILDLNLIDISNVTDLSNLFANFDVSRPKERWNYKISLDISKWNVSSETKMTHLFDNHLVDLGEFRIWDTTTYHEDWDNIESYNNMGFEVILNYKDRHSEKTCFSANDEDFLAILGYHNIPDSNCYYRNGKSVCYPPQPEDASEEQSQLEELPECEHRKTASSDDGADDDLPF